MLLYWCEKEVAFKFGAPRKTGDSWSTINT